jgi:F0F1-type ATP synthase assembly protein I
MGRMTDDDKLIDEGGNVDEDELDRRIRELGLDDSPSIEQARQATDKIDDDFEARLKSLEERAKSQKLIRDNKEREVVRKQNAERDSARGLGIGLSIAYTIIGLPVLGLIIGYILDGGNASQTYKSIGVLAGAALGIVMTFVILAKANRQP